MRSTPGVIAEFIPSQGGWYPGCNVHGKKRKEIFVESIYIYFLSGDFFGYNFAEGGHIDESGDGGDDSSPGHLHYHLYHHRHDHLHHHCQKKKLLFNKKLELIQVHIQFLKHI